MNLNQISCCKTQLGDCNNSTDLAEGSVEKMKIDYLYIDLSVCSRCQGTDQNLKQAVQEVSQILNSTGREVEVNYIHINTLDLALKHQFSTSPTIRINGYDVQLGYKESNCQSCGDFCGSSVDCRVWTYQGLEYDAAPKALLIDAILSTFYGSNDSKKVSDNSYSIPDNIKSFFDRNSDNIRATP